jgi:very-short-patch-repair endonuclease
MLGFDFHRQKPVDNYILDFFCNELNLGIELDGLTHRWEEVAIKDELKENRLNELGIKVLRFADDEVINNITNVLRVIENLIQNEHTPNPSQEGNRYS